MSYYRVGDYGVIFGPGGASSVSFAASPTLTPVSFGAKIAVTGHSVPDNVFDWPWKGVITDAGATPQMISSTGPYSSAQARWVNDYASPDAVKSLLQAGGASYDLFLGTEAHGGGYAGWVSGDASSVAALIEFGDAYGYALLWHNLAASTGAQPFYANFWRDDPSLAFGSAWRANQNIEAPLWDGIIDSVNANRAGGTPAIRLVPWLQVFMGVYDGIQSGAVTGITMASIFADNVHAESDVGRWLQMATVMAVMYQRHPDQLSNAWSLEFSLSASISVGLAAQLRPIVWAACLSNPRTGLAA